jgi:hypothetical protein
MKRFNDPEGHYERLGVDPTASLAEIKIAYRRRAMELHPDRNAATDTTEEFQQLTESAPDTTRIVQPASLLRTQRVAGSLVGVMGLSCAGAMGALCAGAMGVGGSARSRW